MAVGIVILAHHHLHRTKQLAKALASRNVRVVIHVDANTSDDDFDNLRNGLSKNRNIRFAKRFSCDWGAFSLVQAGLSAAEQLLEAWPGVSHVAQISGSCLPIRPVEELVAFLDQNIGRDYVESVCARKGDWVVDGLSAERFTLYFPFSWRKQRWLFDQSVSLQRLFRISRSVPSGLDPHVGSQWWCLSNATLRAILDDPRRAEFDVYFKHCWIPDEGYIPTLVRRHSSDLVATSLTLSRFDDQGRPHLFYDDHADLLVQSDQFFARKIWHGADGLYRRFLGKKKKTQSRKIADDLGLDTVFASAHDRRCKGRNGRLTAGRFPAAAHQMQPASCRDYAVVLGMGHIFENFEPWLADNSKDVVHGRLFKKNAVQFADVSPAVLGAIPDNPKVRDVNPEQFLCNLLWNGKDCRQAFLLELSDTARMAYFVANDRNARLFVLRGGWVLDLLARPARDKRKLRAQARKLAMYEKQFEREIALSGRADVTFCTIGDAITAPNATLQKLCDVTGTTLPTDIPKFRNLSGLRRLLVDLRDAGVPVAQVGDLPDVLPGEPMWAGADALFAIG